MPLWILEKTYAPSGCAASALLPEDPPKSISLSGAQTKGFPGSSNGKDSACNAEDQVQSLVRKIPWRREWLLTPVFLPGKFHGQRSLVGYSPWSSPGQNTGVGSLSLLQQIFPSQELNWCLLHCRRILYQLSYQAGKLFHHWSRQGSP